MNFSAYMLRCSDGSFYTGHTDNLERWIAEHEAGAIAGYTHSRRPVRLVWSETFPTREEALVAELRVKGWSRAKKRALIDGDWTALAVAALPPAERAARAPRLRSGRTDGVGYPESPQIVRAERSRGTADQLCDRTLSVPGPTR